MILEKIHVRKKEKRSGYAILGLILVVLTLIGAFTVASKVVDFGMSIISDEGRKEQMEQVVRPLVMMDPAPMVKMDRAEESTIVQASLWYCLMNEDNTKYTAEQGGGSLVVPATDVEYYCAQLFGPYYKPVHQTIGDYETTYNYDEENNCYYVPMVTKSGYYSPQVVSYYTQNDFYYVRVGYVAPGPIWSTTTGEKKENTPDKYMQYVLQWVDGHFIVTAINEDPDNVNTQAPPASSAPQSSEDSSSQDGENI